jgi:hypothetical protein
MHESSKRSNSNDNDTIERLLRNFRDATQEEERNEVERSMLSLLKGAAPAVHLRLANRLAKLRR